MEYSIQKLAALSGVTTRTLRYYDQIGLLKPLRVSSSGYRIYGPEQVDRLQQILFYRELGVSLEEIDRILSRPDYDRRQALESHRQALLARRQQLDILIDNLTRTIEQEDGERIMSDKEKFAGFMKQKVEENEAKYGSEIRRKYGDKAIDESNAKMMGMGKGQYDAMQQMAAEICVGLEQAVKAGLDPAGEEGQRLAALHKQWLGFTWNFYSKEAHGGLVEMYVLDERFKAYYDGNVEGCAQWLRDAVKAWLEKC